MSDDSSIESRPRGRHPGERSHLTSDGIVAPVERVVREHYSPDMAARSLRVERQFESGELAIVAYSDQSRIVKSLSEISTGIEHFSRYSSRIQRGFSAGANHYMLGAEFAITAIIMMASIARRRADLSGSGMKRVPSSDTTESAQRYQRGSMDRESKFKHGMMQDVPDWLVSLDGSAAAEAGYLFASVLKRPTILMTMQDTFVSLGESHFHDAVLGWLIVDLNSRKVKEVWKGQTRVIAVKNGETIELPVWEDIVEFYQNKPRDARPGNLLTVVLKRSLDRELVDAALASFMLPGSVCIDGGAYPDLAGEWIVRRSGINLRIHRFMYENLNSWSKMKRFLSDRQIGRTV
ncbi:MAG: hypothetical protein K2X93_09515 [Candidatus Obscuribacterales bacterium]|nr:hypothetical protein [Candidatus Obscuribacterales bacterium]